MTVDELRKVLDRIVADGPYYSEATITFYLTPTKEVEVTTVEVYETDVGKHYVSLGADSLSRIIVFDPADTTVRLIDKTQGA